jgi:hypothetical protein
MDPGLESRNRCGRFCAIFDGKRGADDILGQVEAIQRTGRTHGVLRICDWWIGAAVDRVGAGACATAGGCGRINGQAALYSTVSIYPPSAASMTVCYGFVCRRREILAFTPGDRSTLTRILAAGRASAAAERAAVQQAVIWFDRRMGPILGTNKRVANADIRAMDDKHNFDCWDTTRNTTSLLLVLQEWGLFKFHTVGDPHYRGNALVLQLPHNTAVLVERATKVEWVVDMWPRGYAQPPDVMTLVQWMKED